MTSPDQAIRLNTKLQSILSFFKKRTLAVVLTLTGSYVLLFTLAWNFFSSLVLMAVYALSQIGVPDAEQQPFRSYSQTQPVIRSICRASNWVADITQPLISDDVMVQLWEKHHLDWKKSIADFLKSPPKTTQEYQNFEKTLQSIGLRTIHNLDTFNPPEKFYSLTPTASLGASQSLRVCVGRGGSMKVFAYYPNKKPVFYKGNAVMPSALEFHLQYLGKPSGTDETPGHPIVKTTMNINYKESYSLRRLDESWYIKRID